MLVSRAVETVLSSPRVLLAHEERSLWEEVGVWADIRNLVGHEGQWLRRHFRALSKVRNNDRPPPWILLVVETGTKEGQPATATPSWPAPRSCSGRSCFKSIRSQHWSFRSAGDNRRASTSIVMPPGPRLGWVIVAEPNTVAIVGVSAGALVALLGPVITARATDRGQKRKFSPTRNDAPIGRSCERFSTGR